MRAKDYTVLSMCIEAAVDAGWDQAHKHDENPSGEWIRECIEAALHHEINLFFDFEEKTYD